MEWTSFEKKYPQPDTPVLVSDGTRVWSAVWFKINGDIYWSCHGFSGYDMMQEFGDPTYWMPLPEPPK